MNSALGLGRATCGSRLAGPQPMSSTTSLKDWLERSVLPGPDHVHSLNRHGGAFGEGLQRDMGGGVEQNIEYEEDHPETDFQCFGNRLDVFDCTVDMHEEHQHEDHEKNIEGITETGPVVAERNIATSTTRMNAPRQRPK
jgi:hypothetical protein